MNMDFIMLKSQYSYKVVNILIVLGWPPFKDTLCTTPGSQFSELFTCGQVSKLFSQIMTSLYFYFYCFKVNSEWYDVLYNSYSNYQNNVVIKSLQIG